MRTNITTFLVLLAMYQLFVSIKIILSSEYTIKQRIFQLLIIWLIPFFGALLCHYVVSQSGRSLRRQNNSFVRQGFTPEPYSNTIQDIADDLTHH
jgi:dolichyl-phosphate-mannose--protein O-mannosyl transferase